MQRFALALAVTLVLCGATTAQEFFLDKLSAAPGETVNVHVSSTGSEVVSVWRSRYFGDRTRVLQSDPLPTQLQAKSPGSYAETPTSSALEITDRISLEAWIRPVATGDFHAILSKYSNPDHTAYMIYLMPSGHLSFWLSDTGIHNTANRTLTTNPIRVGSWTHVVATYDGQNKRIYLNGQLDVAQPRTGPIFNTPEPVRVGAYGVNSGAVEFFNGEIDSPAIYHRALTEAEIEQRFLERANYSPSQPGVLAGAVAQWNFDEREGATLTDVTGNGHDLTLYNHATRGVAGPSPRTGPKESHAVRFSQEDLYNPSWPVSFTFTVPSTWESGLYLVQIGSIQHPFVIKPKPGAERRIAVLASTNTWIAYNSWSGHSLYTAHRGLQNLNYYVGMLQPNPGARLNVHTPGNGSGHLIDAERYLYKWLDDNGYPFDLYSDLDLHRNADLLDGYDVLMINGHSEYWTTDMMDHVSAYQDRGGSVVNLSGNTMWSRVTFNEDYTVMEGRKYPPHGSSMPPSERWHTQAGGVLGGLMRCVGWPEHDIIGTGYAIGNGSARGWVEVQQPGHWVFAGTGVKLGTPIGQFGLNQGMMFSFETDEVQPLWSPPQIEVLATGVYSSPTSHVRIAECQTRVVTTITTGGEMIYFDHAGGGGVFGIPAVTAGGGLIVDPIATQVVRNVLERFLAPKAACVFRNGSGVNAVGYNCVNAPVVGTEWQATIATGPNTVSTALLLAGAPAQLPFAGGEILVRLVPPPVTSLGLGAHAVPIPLSREFLGASLATQGLRVDAPETLVLFNAQDLTVGR